MSAVILYIICGNVAVNGFVTTWGHQRHFFFSKTTALKLENKKNLF